MTRISLFLLRITFDTIGITGEILGVSICAYFKYKLYCRYT